MSIAKSELILNEDGSIYHLNLLPGDLAKTIITVGDQDRVTEISKHFDRIEVNKHKREFLCHTGYIGQKRLSVISTGIGTDNIDIVFNEIDALFNVNFATREINEELIVLDFIRLGTSGSLQKDIPLGSLLLSETAIGIDNMDIFYTIEDEMRNSKLEGQVRKEVGEQINLYTVRCNKQLFDLFTSHDGFMEGKTLTSIGFYGPQGRKVRNKLKHKNLIHQFASAGITNLEMETSGIYLLAANLGHRALSVNAILANRKEGTFAENPSGVVTDMITKCLEILSRD